MQTPNKYDWFIYIALAFLNGVSDAITVVLLHEVFAVLMSGNIIFSFVNIATKIGFVDFVRLILIVVFIGSNIIAHRYFIRLNVITRFYIVVLISLIYAFVGNYCYAHNYLAQNAAGFLYVAILATVTSVFMNNVFYRIHTTRYNLVAYTMNMLNLAHFIADKKYKEASQVSIPIASFAVGVLAGAVLVKFYQFYTILLALPLLSVMYWWHIQNQKIS